MVIFCIVIYIESPNCLTGDIYNFLFTFKGAVPKKGDEDILANYERLWKAIAEKRDKKTFMFARK